MNAPALSGVLRPKGVSQHEVEALKYHLILSFDFATLRSAQGDSQLKSESVTENIVSIIPRRTGPPVHSHRADERDSIH